MKQIVFAFIQATIILIVTKDMFETVAIFWICLACLYIQSIYFGTKR